MSDDTRSQCENIINECYLKFTQVIVQSRVPCKHLPKTKSRWFNLETHDVTNITNQLLLLKRNKKTYTKLVIEIHFNRNKPSHSNHDENSVLLERWAVSYESNQWKILSPPQCTKGQLF
jgi:hypothetical protein